MKRVLVIALALAAVAALSWGGAQVERAADAPPSLSIFKGSPGDMPSTENDVILAELQKALNVQLEFTTVSADYEQQLNIRIAGGNTPDIFLASDRNQLINIADQDVALQLDDHIDKMPNIKKWYSDADLQKGRVDGKLYAIARRPYARYSTFMIRQDWLDKLGLDMPETLEDFANVCRAFTFDDPDGNGKQDTFAFTSNVGIRSFPPIFGAYGTTFDGNWMIRNNKVVYSTIDPQYKEAIMWIKDLIASKVVDPELLANKGQADLNKSFNGQAGINYRNFWEFYKPEYEKRIKDVNPSADWVQVPALKGPYGSADREWDVAVIQGGLHMLSADLADEPAKLNAALRLFDYITDGEGQRLVLYGVEGVHHKYEGGKITIDPEKIKEVTYAHNWQFTGRDEMLYLSTKYPWSLGYLQFVSDQPVVSVYNGLVGLPDGVNFADKERYEDEEIAKFLYGIRPMSETDEFVNTLFKTYDLQKYIDKATADLKANGYIN